MCIVPVGKNSVDLWDFIGLLCKMTNKILCFRSKKATRNWDLKKIEVFLKKSLTFGVIRSIILMFADQESDRKNLCFRQGFEPFFVICDKGP